MILQIPDSFDVAADCVHMRIVEEEHEQRELSPDLIAAGRLIVEACEFGHGLRCDADAIEHIIKTCLLSLETKPTVQLVLDRLRAARSDYRLALTEGDGILRALLVAQPLTVLDNVFDSEQPHAKVGTRGLFDNDYRLGWPLDGVAEETLLAWCDLDSNIRYPLIASRMVPFTKNPRTDIPAWKPSALALLARAPHKITILGHFVRHLEPMSWFGLRSSTWEKNVRLLEQFENYPDSEVTAYAKQQRDELRAFLEKLKAQELASERCENERFE